MFEEKVLKFESIDTWKVLILEKYWYKTSINKSILESIDAWKV